MYSDEIIIEDIEKYNKMLKEILTEDINFKLLIEDTTLCKHIKPITIQEIKQMKTNKNILIFSLEDFKEMKAKDLLENLKSETLKFIIRKNKIYLIIFSTIDYLEENIVFEYSFLDPKYII